MVQLAYYQHKLKQGYNAKVKLRPLEPEDLVLIKVLGTTKNPTCGKLRPNQEGPYRITLVAGIGAYFLENLDERVIPRKQPENVLLLIKVSFLQVCVLLCKYIKLIAVYFLYKC